MEDRRKRDALAVGDHSLDSWSSGVKGKKERNTGELENNGREESETRKLVDEQRARQSDNRLKN